MEAIGRLGISQKGYRWKLGRLGISQKGYIWKLGRLGIYKPEGV